MATALFTRWFQFQIFAPQSRLHHAGAAGMPPGGPAPTQRVLVDFIHLRRRLEPYIASTGATQVFARRGGAEGWTAPADYAAFARAGGQVPAFAFGPDLWGRPAPVMVPTAEDMRVGLPGDAAWTDFWSGVGYPAGQVVQTPTPAGILPLFVRAGAILPLGILDENDQATRTGAVELRIYPGADGRRILRVDDGGAEIPLAWDDRARELRIGARDGGARGRAGARRFEIVVVRPGRGIGVASPERPDVVADYTGEELRLRLPEAQPRPPAPTGLRASLQDGRLHLAWHEVGPDVIYRLKRLSKVDGLHEDVASALVAPRHAQPLPAAGEVVHFFVTATNAGGEGPASAVLSVAGDPVVSASVQASGQAPENLGAGRVGKKEDVKARPTSPRIEPSRWMNLAGVSGPACAAEPRTRLSRSLAAK